MKAPCLFITALLSSEIHATSNVEFLKSSQNLAYNLFGPGGQNQSLLQGNVNLNPGTWTVSVAYGYDEECSKTFQFLDNKNYLVNPPPLQPGSNFCDIEITERKD